MDYRVAYDVTTTWPDLWFPAFGLIFVAFGLLVWRNRHEPWTARWPLTDAPKARAVFAATYLGFAVFWATTAAGSTLWSHASAVRAMRDGTASVVVGKVEDFHPMPWGGHDTERFRVGNVHFAYSDYAITGGFRNTSSHGGPVKADLWVRIHYTGLLRDATILKLEVWDGSTGARAATP
jgi:hypothetical protein